MTDKYPCIYCVHARLDDERHVRCDMDDYDKLDIATGLSARTTVDYLPYAYTQQHQTCKGNQFVQAGWIRPIWLRLRSRVTPMSVINMMIEE